MALNSAENEYLDALDEITDRAVADGVDLDFITSALSQQGADLIMAVWERVVNLLIKVWIVVFCSAAPAAIWGWKFYASINDKKFVDDPWLNVVCLISLVAVVAQFFNVKAALPFIDRLIKAWKK